MENENQILNSSEEHIDLESVFSRLIIATKGTSLEGYETENLFKAFTVTSSSLEISTNETIRTFSLFIQMVFRGTVQEERLIGKFGKILYEVFNLAAKSIGVTTSNLNSMLQKGEIIAQDLLPKIYTLLIDRYNQ